MFSHTGLHCLCPLYAFCILYWALSPTSLKMTYCVHDYNYFLRLNSKKWNFCVKTFLRLRCNFKVTMVAYYSKLTDQMLACPRKLIKVYKSDVCHHHHSPYRDHKVCFPFAMSVNFQLYITPDCITKDCDNNNDSYSQHFSPLNLYSYPVGDIIPVLQMM